MIITRQKDETRREELGIVEIIDIGECIPPYAVSRYGRVFNQFRVAASRHNRNWPGTDSPLTFFVEGYGWKDSMYGAIYLWGFFSEQECYDFLTGHGIKEYHAWTTDGRPESELRQRLGFPDAWVRRYVSEADC